MTTKKKPLAGLFGTNEDAKPLAAVGTGDEKLACVAVFEGNRVRLVCGEPVDAESVREAADLLAVLDAEDATDDADLEGDEAADDEPEDADALAAGVATKG